MKAFSISALILSLLATTALAGIPPTKYQDGGTDKCVGCFTVDFQDNLTVTKNGNVLEIDGASASGDITDVYNCASGDCNDIVLSDGDELDMSQVSVTDTAEGLILPQHATDCSSSGTTEGQVCWEADADTLYIGDGTTVTQIGGGLFTDGGSHVYATNGENISTGNTAAGTSATDTIVIEVGTSPTSSPANAVQLYAKDVAQNSGLNAVLHAKLNDNAASTTVDDTSTTNNDGTLTGGDNTEDITTTGKINEALHLDGAADYVLFSDNNAYTFSSGSGNDDPFSFSFWVNVDDTDTTQCFLTKSTNGGSGTEEYLVCMFTSGQVRFITKDSGDDQIGRNADSALSASTWTHVVGTYDGSNASSGFNIYIDGTDTDDSDSNSGSYGGMSNLAGSLNIGSRGTNSYMDGVIDDVRLYDYELTQDQVNTLYNSGSGTEDSLGESKAELFAENESGDAINLTDQKKVVSLIVFDDSEDTATGDGAGDVFWRIPSILDGWNLSDVECAVQTAGTTNTTDIQVHNVTDTTDMLSTKCTIDSTETDSNTAATAPVINTDNDGVSTADSIRIDVDAVSTTAAKGLLVELTFQLP